MIKLIPLLIITLFITGCIDYDLVCTTDCEETCMDEITKTKHEYFGDAIKQYNQDDFKCMKKCMEECK